MTSDIGWVAPPQGAVSHVDFAEDDGSIIVGSSVKKKPVTMPRIPGKATAVLDKVLPVKVDSAGKAKIFGLPPAIVYAIVALVLGGGAYLAFKRFGGHRVLANHPFKKRRGRRGRWK